MSSLKRVRAGTVFMVLARTVLLIGVSYVILVPVFLRISQSIMPVQDLYDQSVRWIPRKPTLDHFKMALMHMKYLTALRNSVLLALTVSVIQVMSCAMVGYGLARFRFPGNGLIFAMTIFTLVVPPKIIVVPTYLNFRFFDLLGLLKDNPINLIGSYWPFVLLALTASGFRCGLYVFVMRQFFRGMPRELEEAAYIDGAGLFSTFTRVMLPGAVPGMIVVFLFSFVWQWNDYQYITMLMPGKTFLTYMLDQLLPTMANYIGATDQLTASAGFADNHYLSLVNSAGMLLMICPLLLLYAFTQRYFVESIERTGLVG